MYLALRFRATCSFAWFSRCRADCDHQVERTGCAPRSESAGRGARCMRALTQIARSIFPGPDPLPEINIFFTQAQQRRQRLITVIVSRHARYSVQFSLFVNPSLNCPNVWLNFEWHSAATLGAGWKVSIAILWLQVFLVQPITMIII